MEPQAHDTPPPAKQSKARYVLMILVVGIAAALLYRSWYARHYVSTDNAQIEGHIVPILPKVGGFIRTVTIQDNQFIQAGEVIATLDDRDFRAKLAQANAEVALAQAAAGDPQHAGQATSQIAVAKASAAAAQSNAGAANNTVQQAAANAERARKDFERIQSLVAQKMASPQALDSAAAALKAAEAQWAATRQTATAAGQQSTAANRQIDASQSSLKQAQARVLAAMAMRDVAFNQLQDATLKAPVSGQVSKKALEVGQLVQAGQQVLLLVPTHDLWVSANFKETEIGKIHAGQNVTIEVDAYPGQDFIGKVESIAGATGARFSLLPPDNATGNFTKVVQRVPVRIKITQIPAGVILRPGLSANCKVRIAE